MLKEAHARGVEAALARFGVKQAGFIGDAGRALFGQPGRLFVEGANAFKGNGFMSAKNVLWPAVSGPGGSKLNWLQRAGTAMLPFQVMGAMSQPSDDNAMARGLGAAGTLLGHTYGVPAFGMIGAPVAGAALGAVGRGIGQVFGG